VVVRVCLVVLLFLLLAGMGCLAGPCLDRIRVGRDADVECLDWVCLGCAVDAVAFVGGAVGFHDVCFLEV
jgi:hypothetical protein